MKNLLRFSLLAISLASIPLAQAQLIGPKSITSTNCIQIDTNGLATVAINVSAISGSLQPEGTIGGQTAFNVQVTPAGSISPASTISSNGAYVLAVAGLSSFQVCGISTGTATVYLNGSPAGGNSSASGGGGGGGGTANGLALATSGATAPTPVGTNTCVGNPVIWAQNGAGTYETQASIDPNAIVAGFLDTPGFFNFCRPVFFQTATLPDAGIVFNGAAYNIFTLLTPTQHFGVQEEMGMAVADANTYSTGNIHSRYSELYFRGTPTISTTYVANSKLTFEDLKTGGSKPRVWTAIMGTTRKHTNYDITNCTGGITGASNGACYAAFYGEAQSIIPVNEDQTGASYSAFEGDTSDGGNRALNATGQVFHALVQGSTANRFVNNFGFVSEDFGSAAGYYNFYSKGTASTGFNAFVGPTNFGSLAHASHTVDIVGTLGLGSAQQTTATSGGVVDKYAGISTAGLGFPVEVARVRAVSQTSAIGTTTLLATGAANTDYLVVVTLYCDSTSAAATVSVTISYTDPGSQAQTIAPSAATCTALGASSFAMINSPIVAKTGTNIQYATSIANTPTYDVRIDLYQLGTN